jgi:hypothetical protein
VPRSAWSVSCPRCQRERFRPHDHEVAQHTILSTAQGFVLRKAKSAGLVSAWWRQIILLQYSGLRISQLRAASQHA